MPSMRSAKCTIRSRLSRGRDALRKLIGMDIGAETGALVRNVTRKYPAETPSAMAA